MQLINNRYRIKKIYKAYDDSTMYKVYDLWNENEELLLKLFSNDSRNSALFQEFTDTFIELGSLRHRGIITNHSFDIVSSIDNKPVKSKQYFYTSDFVKGTKLSHYIGKLSIEQIMSVVFQLLEVTSYIAFRGYTYRYINPDNIFVIEDSGDFQIKLINFAQINERTIKSFYDKEYNVFIAPEVRLKQNSIYISSDIYSIGMLFKSMLIGKTSFANEKHFKINAELGLDENQKNSISELVSKLVKKDPDSRPKNCREIVEEINNIFGIDYKINLTEGRNKLNFENRIIGRDKEINDILNMEDRKSVV